MLHEPLDGAALAGRVAALEENDVTGTGVLAPLLEFQKLDLQQPFLHLVASTHHPVVIWVVLAPRVEHCASAIE
jgi:hypothetical protein